MLRSAKTLESAPTVEGFGGSVYLFVPLFLRGGAFRCEPFCADVLSPVVCAVACVGDPSGNVRVFAHGLAGRFSQDLQALTAGLGQQALIDPRPTAGFF